MTPESPQPAHALLSASASHRWLHCPASPRLCENIPEEKSIFADEGTLAHSLGELKLQKYFFPMGAKEYEKAVAKIKKDKIYQPEMDSCTDEYRDYAVSIVAGYSPGMFTVLLEQQVDYSQYAPGGFGTSDCSIIQKLCPDPDGSPNPVALHIIDYKHGKGVAVDAYDNPQLKLYALGVLLKLQQEDRVNLMLYGTPPRQVETITLHIVQPRSGSGNSSFTLTQDDLLYWAENTVKPIAQYAWEGGGGICVPGKWCKDAFCPLRNSCRARAKAVLASMFDDRTLEEQKTLRDAEIGELMDLTESFDSWRKGLAIEAYKRANNGGVPGYKLVRGKSDRSWKNPREAAVKLVAAGLAEEDIYTERTLISPAQIEGLMGRQVFKELMEPDVIKPPGKPVLAREDDKRQSVNAVLDALAGVEMEE